MSESTLELAKPLAGQWPEDSEIGRVAQALVEIGRHHNYRSQSNTGNALFRQDTASILHSKGDGA